MLPAAPQDASQMPLGGGERRGGNRRKHEEGDEDEDQEEEEEEGVRRRRARRMRRRKRVKRIYVYGYIFCVFISHFNVYTFRMIFACL